MAPPLGTCASVVSYIESLGYTQAFILSLSNLDEVAGRNAALNSVRWYLPADSHLILSVRDAWRG